MLCPVKTAGTIHQAAIENLNLSIPTGTSERTLMDHLNAAMTLAMLTSAPGSPVIACRLSAARGGASSSKVN